MRRANLRRLCAVLFVRICFFVVCVSDFADGIELFELHMCTPILTADAHVSSLSGRAFEGRSDATTADAACAACLVGFAPVCLTVCSFGVSLR